MTLIPLWGVRVKDEDSKKLGSMSIPRAAAGDEYRGYTIPRGCTVILNQWALNNNEELYPDPFTFNPNR